MAHHQAEMTTIYAVCNDPIAQNTPRCLAFERRGARLDLCARGIFCPIGRAGLRRGSRTNRETGAGAAGRTATAKSGMYSRRAA